MKALHPAMCVGRGKAGRRRLSKGWNLLKERDELDRTVRLALDIGMRMLTCGAQISRVEDTIARICMAWDAVETHVFSVTSGIIVTAFNARGTAPRSCGAYAQKRLIS